MGVEAPGWQGVKTQEYSLSQIFTTQPGEMNRRSGCEVIFSTAHGAGVTSKAHEPIATDFRGLNADTEVELLATWAEMARIPAAYVISDPSFIRVNPC